MRDWIGSSQWDQLLPAPPRTHAQHVISPRTSGVQSSLQSGPWCAPWLQGHQQA